MHACVPGVPDCLCRRLGTWRRAVSKSSKLESSPSGLVLVCPVLRRISKRRLQDVTRICPQGKYAWLLAQSTCYRRELRATGSKGCREPCPPDSSDAEA